MKTTYKYIKLVLLSGLLLMAFADRAKAREIPVSSDTLWTTISPAPTKDDNITVSGGKLIVNTDATCNNLTISGSPTVATVAFLDSATARTLTVNGNLSFAGNTFDMSSPLNGAQHVLVMKGNATAVGTFLAGFGTVIYNGGAQTVAPLSYKNLTLGGTGVKTVANGAAVNAALVITETATLTGSPFIYSAGATLEYNSTTAQTTSVIEFPPTMGNPVLVTTAAGVSLEANKTLTKALTIIGTFKDGGNVLTLTGDLFNYGTHSGGGYITFGGAANQTLYGTGKSGNITVNQSSSSAVVVFNDNAVILGRLILSGAGKLRLNNSTAPNTALLTYSGLDKTPGTYGSKASPATTQSDTVFDPGFTGVLTVKSKPAPIFANLTASPNSYEYASKSITVTGKISGGDNGNNSEGGVTVTVTINTATAIPNATPILTANDGTFTTTFNNVVIPCPGASITVTYAGGSNLGSGTDSSINIQVNKKAIVVTPQNLSKVYGAADPTDLVTKDPSLLVGADTYSGSATRDPGSNVGAYAITQGTFGVNGKTTPDNYTITFTTGKTLTITRKSVAITPTAGQFKIYGNSNPTYTYAVTPALITGDSFGSTALSRATGEGVANYNITIGTLSAGNNYDLTLNPAQFQIRSRAITLNAKQDLTKVYGSADPALNPTVVTVDASTPMPSNGDYLTGDLSRVGGETVAGSPYTINQGGLTIKNGDNSVYGNYTVTFNTGKMAITKKSVQIAPVNPVANYGDSIKALVSYTGLIGTTDPQRVPAQTATATLPTITWTGTAPTPLSAAGTYAYKINNNAADPNYDITYAGNLNGTYTVNIKQLTIKADNKTKLADGSVYGGFTYTISGVVAGDTDGISGVVSFAGDAVTATQEGIYTIGFASPSGLTSSKYELVYQTGKLVITGTQIGKTTTANSKTWGPGGDLSYNWQINNAKGGAGADPGWRLQDITGSGNTLTISANSANPFILNVTTLPIGSYVAGKMANFDPTRNYAWKIAQAAGGIVGFTGIEQFQINTAGIGFFANDTYGGTFSVAQVNNQIDLTYTPNPSPNVSSLLTGVKTSGVDYLALEANGGVYTITPQQTITINLNVGHLSQAVVGAQAFIQFDSRFFMANQSGAGAPVIAPGGGDWTEVISKMWRVNNAHDGDMDMVIGVKLGGVAAGTTIDGTVAKITLTPTATATGKSRVIFRPDLDPTAAEPVATTTLATANNGPILPVRVMSDDIVVVIDKDAPSIGAITATQDQPHVGTKDVKRGTGSSGSAVNTVRGTVNFSVVASDAGVGLNGKPSLKLSQAGQADVFLTAGNDASPFTYSWNVTAATANGTWNATVTAQDKAVYRQNLDGSTGGANGAATATFDLIVNTRQISGVVELESYKGVSRIVKFTTHDNANGDTHKKAWSPALNFTSGALLPAGSFKNLSGLAAALKNPADNVSTFLRYGEMPNPGAVASALLNNSGISGKIRTQLFGSIAAADLAKIADLLKPGNGQQSALHYYLYNRLSGATQGKLANYQTARGTSGGPSGTQIADLTAGFLIDFNEIVRGNSIYDTLRFTSVAGLLDFANVVNPVLAKINNSSVTNDELDAFNRYLLEKSFTVNNALTYYKGTLHPDTAAALVAYPGAGSANLVALLLQDLYTVSLSSTLLYNDQDFLGIPLSPATVSAYLAAIGSTDPVTIANVNMMLLGDTYAGSYTAPKLPRDTEVALDSYNAADPASVATLANQLVRDFNSLINGGVSLNQGSRFAQFSGGFAGELATLNALPSPTSAQLVRLNRLLLEFVYDGLLSKSVLASYTLTDVPDGVTEVSAKTAWNLRVKIGGISVAGPAFAATANFVSDAVPGYSAADRYLRGGDMNDNNTINVADYNVLRGNWNTAASGPADVDGDGVVDASSGDYDLLRQNWLKTGDDEVQ